MNILSFIIPTIVDEAYSTFNGKIYVKEFFGRKYIEVGGLMQSGKIPRDLFLKGFQHFKIHSGHLHFKKILVLGVGGGTIITLLVHQFPDAEIIGIDIDPVIIEMGKKYFHLHTYQNVRFKIGDIFDPKLLLGKNYDLIIVDIFRGYEIPQKLGNKEFLRKLRNACTKNGIILFNRLYFQKYAQEADSFLVQLKKVYTDVEIFKWQFNVLFLARESA